MSAPDDPVEPSDPVEHRQIRFEAPAGASSILLIRHGESAARLPDRPFELVGGHGDPPLHPDGQDQARLVAERLHSQPLTAIYVSTLRRTAETAAPLAARLELTPVVEPDLREVYLGAWENEQYRTRVVAAGDPIALRVWTEERWDLIPGAEGAEEFSARVAAGIERIAARHHDERVAVFTHGGVIGAILARAARSRPFAFVGADNASISELVIIGSHWILRSYNDTAHLEMDFADPGAFI